MIKVKIVKFFLELPLNRLIEKFSDLSGHNFQDNSFTLTEFNENSVSAVYVEKVVTRETVIDLQGRESEVEVVRFPRYEFQLQKFGSDGFLLLVFNPPRSLKGLVDFLLKEVDGHIYFRESKVSVDDFIENAKSFDSILSVRADKIKAKGISISSSSYADVSVSSSLNAYVDLEEFLQEKKFKISSARLRVRTKFGSGKVEVSSSGLLGIDESVFDEILAGFIESSKDIVLV
ncbi:hypothetical protein [Halomonas sp. AOP43-D1-4]|uniref:hypothetical protein n=1 Tax=Halomonas sp. AOP43-D1-4 TaxID=3457658 RepID=UPI0040344245